MLAFRHFDCQSGRIVPNAAGFAQTQCSCGLPANSNFLKTRNQLDLIAQSRTDTAAYEEFLRKAEDLVKRLASQQPENGIPAVLHGKREAAVIFNNLESIAGPKFQCSTDAEERAVLACKIDLAVREHAPAGWKGDQAREAQVLNALFPILNRDREATKALFEIIKNQSGYL